MVDDYEATLAQLEASLQVQHVAQRPLLTISARAGIGEARGLAANLTLNNLPVVDDTGSIIGVLENLNGEIPDYARPREDVRVVRHAMRSLTDRMLVESRCSLERLFRDLLSPPFYQLVVTAGQVDGIVTVADLNKAPVRVVSYTTVARLETAMGAAIRSKTNHDDDAAIAELGKDAAAQVRDLHRRLKAAYLNVDLLDATTFKQKGMILAGLSVFENSGEITVRSEFELLYERLRNPLMHMGPLVAESIDGLREFAADLERARYRTAQAIAAAA
jgi:CBS domain-containing protein